MNALLNVLFIIGCVAVTDPGTIAMNTENPTAQGRWRAVLAQVLPEPTPLALSNVHLVGPFENAGFQGLLRAYPPEHEIDLLAVYQGKAGEARWRRMPGLDGLLEEPADLGECLPPEAWSVLYVYAEVTVEEPHIAELAASLPPNVWAWINGELALAPTYFGKVLTPSHEATNLSLHSGAPVGSHGHKPPVVPEFCQDKVY